MRRHLVAPFFFLSLLAAARAPLAGGDAAADPAGDPEGEEDWTTGCPRGCRCKWVSGKRTAECQDAGMDRLPDFGRADKIQVGPK